MMNKGLSASRLSATKAAFEHIDSLYPDLDPLDYQDSMVRQKLVETELGVYCPEGEELDDPRFQLALKLRLMPGQVGGRA